MGIEASVKVPDVLDCVVVLAGVVLIEAPATGAPLALATVPAIDPVAPPGVPFEPEHAASTMPKRSITVPGPSVRIPPLLPLPLTSTAIPLPMNGKRIRNAHAATLWRIGFMAFISNVLMRASHFIPIDRPIHSWLVRERKKSYPSNYEGFCAVPYTLTERKHNQHLLVIFSIRRLEIRWEDALTTPKLTIERIDQHGRGDFEFPGPD
jgi:hypothetical protein